MTFNDGGPAFPRPYSVTTNSYEMGEQDGMTLREWCAGAGAGGVASR